MERRFNSFKAASAYAGILAKENRTSVRIRRDATAWIVVFSEHAHQLDGATEQKSPVQTIGKTVGLTQELKGSFHPIVINGRTTSEVRAGSTNYIKHMDDVENILNKLNKITNYYYGISLQRRAFNDTLSQLHELLNRNLDLDISRIQSQISSLQKRINDTGQVTELNFRIPAISQETYSKGDLVFHKVEYYIGRIDGKTTLRNIFENPEDEKEYRVVLPGRAIETRMIASVSNLLLLSKFDQKSGYQSRCWSCENPITYQLLKCRICGWFKCFHCDACGCGYMTCPKCGGMLNERYNRQRGKHFWGCGNYPECSYTRK